MMHQVFSIVAPLANTPDRPSRIELSPTGHTIATAECVGLEAQFRALPMVHYASIQVFSGDAPSPEASFQPHLVFESCIDGPVDTYLEALVATDTGLIAATFERCRDFPAEHRGRPERLIAYLKKKVHRPQLFHIGAPNLRVDHVTAGHQLRVALDEELDTIVARGRSHDPPTAIVDEVRLKTQVPPSSKRHWHLEVQEGTSTRYGWFADPAPVAWSRLRAWLAFGALLLLPLAAAAALLWVVFTQPIGTLMLLLLGGALGLQLLRRWWRGWNEAPVTVDKEALRRLKDLEDFGIQNHMASLLLLKPGRARRLAITTVLRVFNVIYRTWYTDITPGRLQGLPTIHFAQWSLVRVADRRGRPRDALLFLSNYDGSWESYLDDFLTHLFAGVVMIWANTESFPYPLDAPTFKRWARGCMSPWQFWYRAYPDLTVVNIHNNEQIRRGLLRAPRTEPEARLWLARFGSVLQGDETVEPPLGTLETHDIQGLVFSGYRHLPHAAYVLLRIEQPEPARRWLVNLVPRVTDARDRRSAELKQQTLAYNVAFTWPGLRALGLPDSALARFADSFQEGLAPVADCHRSRVLGDVGANAPERWAWGTGADRADILLMIFASDPLTLSAEARAQVGAFTSRQAGVKVAEMSGSLLLGNEDGVEARLTREHFGFIDGLSQPEIEGARRAKSAGAEAAGHLVKPGEFLLGYSANDGTVTPGIPISPTTDYDRILPVAAESPEQRDFGRNGSYLVFRQLAQDVAAFRRSTAKAAGATSWATGSGAAEHIAARMIGRWRDGSPLLPHRPGAESRSTAADANQFGFTDDPHGFGCPIGAHIRRANPRDSLQPDPAAALRSANRHRLLRRGRPYGPPLPEAATKDDGQDRGMAFICLNSDIERQFEFVQQNWINNPAFGGLYAERDPVMGTAVGNGGCLTLQASGVRQRMNGFGQFVTVKGGDYFFLPGMSALRYLTSLEGAARVPAGALIPAPAAAPVAPPRFPTALHAGLTRAEGLLRALRAAWGARFPLLLATALVCLAVAPLRFPAIATNLFVMDRIGIAICALFASLTAYVVMITLRLVLMYGWRSTPGRSRWRRNATWPQVLAFQALALPVVSAAVHYSAVDLTDASGITRYWGTIAGYLPPVLIGMVAAIGILATVNGLQALRPDSGSGLFFPPTRLTRTLGQPQWRPRGLWRVSARFSHLSQWIVDSVPEEIGYGYIDYRRRRILPGHVVALSLGLAMLAAYVVAGIALSPARCAPDDWLPGFVSRGLCGVSDRVPALAYLLALFVTVGWLLAGLSFFLDRYRVATVLVLGIWLAFVASVARTDHFFEVGAAVEAPPLPPAEAMRTARLQHPGSSRVIVVAAEGFGLASSAWTAQVLTELARLDGFASSLRLISASSGAALGSVSFVNAYRSPGSFPDGRTPAELEAIRARAGTPATSQLGWGLAYPDLARTFVPWLVHPLRDRGWAMERAWSRAAADPSDATLAGWRRGVAEGWRPAVAFGVTLVETGGRGLLATYDPPGNLPDVTLGHDLSVFTAARLSAAFPFISPLARADASGTAYHVADGGYWDNSGVVSAIEWLDAAAPQLQDADVMLIEIAAASRAERPRDDDDAWTLDFTGPLRTMIRVRDDAQPARNRSELRLFSEVWQARFGRPLHRARFALGVPDVPLTWSLTRSDARRIGNAWRREEIAGQTAIVRQFLGN